MEDFRSHGASVKSSNFQTSCKCENDCDAAVVFSDTLPKADNFPVCGGDFKIPKVLAEFIVQIDSESVIRLNEPAFEIKRVEKQVFLTECRFIPPTDKLFIEGYIRKNIEYSAKRCTKGSAIAGSIKDVTVHVPFRAYTMVDFKGGNRPQIKPDLPPVVARYFDEKRMGKDIREADRANVEIFNEPVFCELEWSAVFDADTDHKGCPIDGFKNEEEFQEFTDKSVVFMQIKLLQKQQFKWPEKQMSYYKDEPVVKKPAGEWNMPIQEYLGREQD